METQIHKFEEAGLGKAPFKFIRVFEKVYVSCPGAPAQAAGTCDYCGNGIKYCCVIRDKDGKEFIVGNECVKKTEDAGLHSVTDKAVRSMISEAKRVAKFEANKAKAAEAERIFRSGQIDAALKALPHPNTYMADKGLTKYDYIEWILVNAGLQKRAEYLQYFNSLTQGA